MHVISKVISFVVTAAVLGGVLFFVYYSLYIYKPTGRLACGQSQVSQQTDVAINAVRQAFGREGQFYSSCPTQSN